MRHVRKFSLLPPGSARAGGRFFIVAGSVIDTHGHRQQSNQDVLPTPQGPPSAPAGRKGRIGLAKFQGGLCGHARRGGWHLAKSRS
jgi:hypothetical protein